jgi:hypothetical protein
MHIKYNLCTQSTYEQAQLCRFEGEVICEDPREVDAGIDWQAHGQSQISIPVVGLPRYIWYGHVCVACLSYDDFMH